MNSQQLEGAVMSNYLDVRNFSVPPDVNNNWERQKLLE